MRSFAALLLLGTSVSAISMQRSGRDSLDSLMLAKRADTCVPVPAPATCEKSCGPGNIQCVAFPNCYNPGVGETCCSDGKYCPAGTYCTDAGCCPNGASLEECQARTSLSVIAPETPAPTPAPTSSSSSSSYYPITSSAYTPYNETNATASLIPPPQATTNAAAALQAGVGLIGGVLGLMMFL